MLKENFMFVAAAARFSDLLYLSVRDRELVAKEKTHSIFCGYDRGEPCKCGSPAPWDTQAMCVVRKPIEKLIAVSNEGHVHAYVGGEEAKETIDPKPYDIAGLATIDGYAYACGADRQVYKRVDEGKWVPMHAPDSSGLIGMHGFASIAGYSEADMYAAGWQGEIWHYDGKRWRQIDSPTKEKLSLVVCGDDGQVYVGGRHGVLVRGRGDRWSVTNSDGYNGDIWGMQWFNNRLYTASLNCLCELAGDDLVQVNIGKDKPATCYHLTSAEGVMWSVGTDDIFSFDGRTWTRIE